MSIQTSGKYSDIARKRLDYAKHHRMASSLREARNKVLQKTGIASSEHDYELLQLFVRNELSSAFTIPIFAIIIALACSFWAPLNHTLLWLSCVFISKGILLRLCRLFSEIPKELADTPKWRAKIMAAEFLYAVSWASIVFFDTSNTTYPAHFFIFACILSVIAMRIMFASSVLQIVYIGTIPMTVALTIRFLMTDDMFYWSMALMAICIHFYFCILAENLHKNALNLLAYRAEKDFLIAEIEEAKIFSDEARRRAEEANYAKSCFLATMSHELRTPLNAILGFSEVMRDEIFGRHQNSKYKDYAKDIYESGQHLLNLINEILDLSRIEAGHYELHEELLKLSDVVEDSVHLTKLRAESKNINLIEEYHDDAVKLWSDERAIRQICLNLLSNAIKFTPSGGSITLNISLNGEGELVLSVKDTGPGIPEEEIPIILTNFGQGSLAHTVAEGGSGLGLPIVQGLIEIQDGRFRLESELRKGTEAIVTFPAKRVTQTLPRMPVPGEANYSSKHQEIPSAHLQKQDSLHAKLNTAEKKQSIVIKSKLDELKRKNQESEKTPTVEDIRQLAYLKDGDNP